jgi:hypothetical protein
VLSQPLLSGRDSIQALVEPLADQILKRIEFCFYPVCKRSDLADGLLELPHLTRGCILHKSIAVLLNVLHSDGHDQSKVL